MRCPAPLLALSLAAAASAQTIADVRDELRSALSSARYAAFVAGFAGLSGEPALTGINFVVDDPSVDTSFAVWTYPLSTELEVGGGLPNMRLEGDFGYVTARTDYPDAFGAGSPALATRVTSRFTTYGGVVGGGPRLALRDWSLTPIALGGVARVENDARYGGPGAGVAAAVFDGLLFNWDATYALYGGALLVEPPALALGEVRLLSQLRYDFRRSDPLQVDDPALGGGEDQHWAVLRLDAEGPTGWRLGGRSVSWAGLLGYKHFFGETGDLLGFRDYYEVGGGLTWDCGDALPVVRQVGLRVALLYGEDVRGWTIGGVFRF